MSQIDQAFEIQDGLSLDGKVLLYFTTVDPSVVGFDAPIGSILMDTINGIQWRKIGATIYNWTKFGVSQFGLVVLFEKSEGQSTTSSTTYQTKLTLTTPSLEAGTYRIGWNSLVGNLDNNKESEYRLLMNDVTEIESMYIQSVKLEFDQVFTGFSFQSVSGINTFKLQHRAITGTSRIEQTSIEFWKAL